MEEKELIGKIRGLRQIKPNRDWVSLTKSQILGDVEVKPQPFYFPLFKPVYAGLIAVLILFGLFGFAKNSLPGDLLYPIKKIAQKSRAVFVSEEEKPAFQLKLANQRLEDLTKASTKNLAPTINEFQVNISEAAKTISKIDATTSDPIVTKKIVEEAQKLKKNKQIAETLGVVTGETEELEEALIPYYKVEAERQIKDLENRSLTEGQQKLLEEAKEEFEAGNYDQALEKIWILSQ